MLMTKPEPGGPEEAKILCLMLRKLLNSPPKNESGELSIPKTKIHRILKVQLQKNCLQKIQTVQMTKEKNYHFFYVCHFQSVSKD